MRQRHTVVCVCELLRVCVCVWVTAVAVTALPLLCSNFYSCNWTCGLHPKASFSSYGVSLFRLLRSKSVDTTYLVGSFALVEER